MTGLVREWERGDESRQAFAARHGLTVSQFAYWRRRVRRTPTLVPLQVVRDPSSTAPAVRSSGVPIELTLSGGERLLIGEGVSAAMLQAVLTASRRS